MVIKRNAPLIALVVQFVSTFSFLNYFIKKKIFPFCLLEVFFRVASFLRDRSEMMSIEKIISYL